MDQLINLLLNVITFKIIFKWVQIGNKTDYLLHLTF